MKTSVFIIEDNPMYSMYVMLKLDDMFNYTTHLFSSAEEAISNMHLKPDIIVMDYMLPEMNGVEAMKKIKLLSPKTKTAIMSSQTDPGIVSYILSEGAFAYIQKDKSATQKIIDTIVELTKGKR